MSFWNDCHTIRSYPDLLTFVSIASHEYVLHLIYSYVMAWIRRCWEILTLVENMQTLGHLFEPLYILYWMNVMNHLFPFSQECLTRVPLQPALLVGGLRWPLNVDCLSILADLLPPSVAFAFAALLPAIFLLLFEGPAGAVVVVTHQYKFDNDSRSLTSFLKILFFLFSLGLCGCNAQPRSMWITCISIHTNLLSMEFQGAPQPDVRFGDFAPLTCLCYYWAN